jgi:exodeoxyribonuclease-3
MVQKIKIATWNMACAQPKYRKNFNDAWEYYLNEIDVDFSFFQEGIKPKTAEGSLIYHEIGGPRNWGSGIYSKKYEISEENVSFCSPKFIGSCVLANSKIDEKTTLTLISLYGLFEKIGNVGYTIPNLHRVLSDLTGILNSHINGKRQVILGGDLNASIQCDHQWKGNTHKIFFDRLDDFKLFNCFMPFYKDFVQTHWRADSRIPWQNDYFFISKTLSKKLVNCEVMSNEQVRKYSDHNPVIITLCL